MLSFLFTIILSIHAAGYASAEQDSCPANFAKIVGKKAYTVTESFSTLPDGRKVFYRYTKGSDPNKTIVALNGLIYPDAQWNQYIEKMRAKGYSIVQIYFSGHPESLLGLPKGSSANFLDTPLTPQRLSEEVSAVLTDTKIDHPIHLLTLSYGAVGVEFAKENKDKVKDLTMMAPLVVSLDKYNPDAQAFHNAMQGYQGMASLFDPFNMFGAKSNAVQMENKLYQDAVDKMIQAGIDKGRKPPDGLEPDLYKRGIVSLVMGAKEFDLKNYAHEALPKINLILASREDPPALLKDQQAFWEMLPATGRGAIVLLDGGEHAMAGANPQASAIITDKLWSGQIDGGSHTISAKSKK